MGRTRPGGRGEGIIKRTAAGSHGLRLRLGRVRPESPHVLGVWI